ncbi:MAG: hypothetical protein IT463_05815 [Planctomycetes bacterium]|nr:hypothetical protein [Planctomycetota bacterium]
MSNELKPDGFELQPDGMGDFAAEEAPSEEAAHLVPAIRELPQDKEFSPAAFYALQISDGQPSSPPQPLNALLGQGLFQSLTDVHLFGRGSASEPWLEIGPLSPEPVQILVAQELFPASGQALAEDDLGMFEMVAGRIAKTLKRQKQPPAETPAQAAQRSSGLAALKGRFRDALTLKLTGSFDLAQVIDCCLCLGMRRAGTAFGWFGVMASDEPTFTVSSTAPLTAGARGPAQAVSFTLQPAKVTQPGKALERMVTAMNYFKRRIAGNIVEASGQPPAEGVARGEHPLLAAAVKKITDAGLRPGQVVTRRLA